MYFLIFSGFCAFLVLAVFALGKVFDHYEQKEKEKRPPKVLG